MDPRLWQRIKPLFAAAYELPREQWPSFLDAHCPDDPALRQELEALLEGDRRASETFLERPADVSPNGRRIGAYELIRHLGSGGMGQIYLARRADDEFEKRVALKLLRPDMVDDETVGRFLRERQILAGLDHPSIAKLLDGGTTEEGLPFLVMDYVEGQRIDEYCDRRELSTADRLVLFCAVCEAVHFAHQNQVVHRDLKPANILVTVEGEPKLLDFGVAKLLNPELSFRLAPTVLGHPMTPDYASPEQILGEPVTTASDVYALGVLLYRLLSGRSPYSTDGRSPAEWVRIICEDAPERLGAAVDRDLDNIVRMALRKEPQRRYASVEQFAADIRRYLDGWPVLATGDTWVYRGGKFVRRHLLGVAAAAVLIVALLGFAIVMATQRSMIAHERDQARVERDRAEEVSKLLVELFEVSDPLRQTGEEISAREILDRGAARIAGELEDQPEAQAALLTTLGVIYQRLALYDRAMPLLESALRGRRAMLGDEHPDVAATLEALATAWFEKGDLDMAESLYRESLAIRLALDGPLHADVATSRNHLANVHWTRGELDAAEVLYRQVLATRRQLLGDEHEDVATSLNNLANLRFAQDEIESAEDLHREALRLRRRLLDKHHPDVGESQNNLAVVLWRRGKLEESRALYEAALEVQRVRYGEEHPVVYDTLGNLGALLHDLGDDASAEALQRQVLDYYRRELGEYHVAVARATNQLARLRKDQGALDEAEELYRTAIAILRANDTQHVPLGATLTALAEVQALAGACEDAEALAGEALRILEQVLPDHHRRIAAAERVLADCGSSGTSFSAAHRHDSGTEKK